MKKSAGEYIFNLFTRSEKRTLFNTTSSEFYKGDRPLIGMMLKNYDREYLKNLVDPDLLDVNRDARHRLLEERYMFA